MGTTTTGGLSSIRHLSISHPFPCGAHSVCSGGGGGGGNCSGVWGSFGAFKSLLPAVSFHTLTVESRYGFHAPIFLIPSLFPSLYRKLPFHNLFSHYTRCTYRSFENSMTSSSAYIHKTFIASTSLIFFFLLIQR